MTGRSGRWRVLPHVLYLSEDAVAPVDLEVLIVEDDPDARRAVRAMLEDSALQLPPDWPEIRVQVQDAPDLMTALGVLKEGLVQVILADLNLPDSGGADTVRALRRADHQASILVLSNQDDVPTAMETALAGASAFIAKAELTPAALARAIAISLIRTGAQGPVATAPHDADAHREKTERPTA